MNYSGCDTSIDMNDCDETLPAVDPIMTATSAEGMGSSNEEIDSLRVSIPIPFCHPLLNVGSDPSTPWTTNLKKPVLKDFYPQEPTGPTFPVPDSPSEIFRMFYTSELLDLVTAETNKYAEQVMTPQKILKFTPVSKLDIEAFMGFNILMGINSLPSLAMYWGNDSIHHYAPIADRISRERYKQISRYLHFCDNTSLAPLGTPSYDRLGKVRPLMEYLSTKFCSLYSPGENLAVDEAMIKFQGRSTLKQYMPMKPIKRGIKVWVLADENGFFSHFEVYTGKKDGVEHSLGARVVKDLTKDFQGSWRHVYFDSFFTSKELLCDLESKRIYGCGTARKDRRGFPAELKTKKLKSR